MTNGEKIKALFPDMYQVEQSSGDWESWWNAEYQEPTTKNDLGVDCISRQAALDITWHDPSYSDPLNVLTEVRDKIRELPSVTPQEPRKGYWLRRPHVYGVTYCSICDFELKINNTNYCPNCGADMREVEE